MDFCWGNPGSVPTETHMSHWQCQEGYLARRKSRTLQANVSEPLNLRQCKTLKAECRQSHTAVMVSGVGRRSTTVPCCITYRCVSSATSTQLADEPSAVFSVAVTALLTFTTSVPTPCDKYFHKLIHILQIHNTVTTDKLCIKKCSVSG